MREQIRRALKKRSAYWCILIVLVSSVLKIAGPSLLCFLQWTRLNAAEPPSPFGGFHCFFVAVGLLLGWTLGKERKTLYCRRIEPSDRLLLRFGAVLLGMETYKQSLCFWVLGNGAYDLALLPLQLCSLPLYACLMAPYFKDGRVKRSAVAFLAVTCLVGGIPVTVYPTLSPQLNLSAHTVLWHSLMVVLGILLVIRGEVGKRPREELGGVAALLFSALIVSALLNGWLGREGQVDLCYLNPHAGEGLPVFGSIRERLGWLPSVVAYAGCFLAAGAVPILLSGGFFANRRGNQKK